MAITVNLAEDGTVQVRTPDIGAFVQHFGERISPRGLLLETADSLPRGRELDLRLGLDEGLNLVEAVAMVAWTRRQAGEQPAAVGLHLLAVTSGAEFIQRLVTEREQAGRPVFDLDLASPLSEDGSPIEADQIDRMIASRGQRSAAADLEVGGGDPEPESGEVEEAPDFAPGFGKNETWNQDLQAEMPRSVSSWLGDTNKDGAAGDRPAAPPAREQSAPVEAKLGAPDPDPGLDTSDRPTTTEATTPKDEVTPKEVVASASDEGQPKPEEKLPGRPAAPAKAGQESWRSSNPEVQPPAEIAPGSGPLKREAAPGAELRPDSAKRSGPIKMKLAADRQPSGGSASQTLSGALESSFVEASRRANNLLSDDHLKVDSSEPTPVDSLSTVVLKPDEMKRMVDRVRDRVEDETQPGSGSSPEPRPALDAEDSSDARADVPSSPSDAGGAFGVSAGRADATAGEGASDGEVAEADPSQLDIDRSILESSAEGAFGYPQEDRTPMIIVGGIVLLIVVALILWLVLT